MKKVAKVFLIIGIVCLIITGICFIITKVNENKADNAYKDYNSVKYGDNDYYTYRNTYYKYTGAGSRAFSGTIIAGISAGTFIILGIALNVLNRVKEKKGRDFFYKVLLGIGLFIIVAGIIGTIIGAIIDSWFLKEGGWLLAFACGSIGGSFIWGYVTYRLMKGKDYSFLLGFILGIIGVVIAIVKRTDKQEETNSNNISSSNKYEDLEKLQKLKESGVITEAEFKAEKAKLLK